MSRFSNIARVEDTIVDMDISLPDQALLYVLYQRTDYLVIPRTRIFNIIDQAIPFDLYSSAVKFESKFRGNQIRNAFNQDIVKEYTTISSALPQNCSRVLDIGCGVGGIDVLLYRHYESYNPMFYLLDKTAVEDSVFYGFKSVGAFYNSLDITSDVLTGNGIPEEQYSLLYATDDGRIEIEQPLDLVISLISWGFHYPVDTYLNRVHELLADGGSLILDVRRNTDGEEKIRATFRDVNVISKQNKYRRLLATK